MDDKNLVEKQNVGFFSKVKNWFKSLFGIKEETSSQNEVQDLEFENQPNANVKEDDFEEIYNEQEKLQYEFSNNTVSKQKIERIRLELNNGKIGVEELYQLSDLELEELDKSYDAQIEDTVLKLNEIETSLNGYKRKLSKLQNIN